MLSSVARPHENQKSRGEGNPVNLTGSVLAPLGQSADGGWIDGIAPSYIGSGLTVSEPCESFLSLMWDELARSTEPHTTRMHPPPDAARRRASGGGRVGLLQRRAFGR